MQHRTRVVTTSDGIVGVCSCGYVTPPGLANEDARRAIGDHEVTALRTGVKVTYLEAAEPPKKR